MAGQGSVRPLCQVANPVKIDAGTTIRHCTPKPAPVIQPLVRNRCRQISVGALIFDEDQLIAFLDSVAHAKVAEKHIKVVWKDYDESTVLNIIYSIPGMGKPGMVEVDTGDINQILAETETESKKLQDQFCLAMARGPARLVHWLQVQEDIRNTHPRPFRKRIAKRKNSITRCRLRRGVRLRG